MLYVAEDRTQASLDRFWPTLTEGQRESIEAIAMDMWGPYVASVCEHVREGSQEIVYDKFHIAKHLGDDGDKVRLQENRPLRAAGDDRLRGHATTGCGIQRPWNRPIVEPLPSYVRAG